MAPTSYSRVIYRANFCVWLCQVAGDIQFIPSLSPTSPPADNRLPAAAATATYLKTYRLKLNNSLSLCCQRRAIVSTTTKVRLFRRDIFAMMKTESTPIWRLFFRSQQQKRTETSLIAAAHVARNKSPLQFSFSPSRNDRCAAPMFCSQRVRQSSV